MNKSKDYNIFLREIYLFDDRLTLILNGGDRQITIDDEPHVGRDAVHN